MSNTPFAQTESLRIGVIEFISPDEVKVGLEIEAPESVALNAGTVRPFPRVGSYVLMPVEDGHLVGQVEWLTIERSPFPKRQGIQDFGLLDLPYPLRRMSLRPLGMLRRSATGEPAFRRGAEVLPSVGTPVLLPTDTQLRSVVESGERRRVGIGISPLADGARVMVDPDRLFGRHLAVLGNTGSGKSCTTAGLIRWSLEEARSQRQNGGAPAARFVILDPNGEYSRAFAGPVGGIHVRVFSVDPGEGQHRLRVPLWFWNSAEWCAFTQASAKTQRPTLIQALRLAREGLTEPSGDQQHDLRRFLRTIVATIRAEKNAGVPWGTFPKPKNFLQKIVRWGETLTGQIDALPPETRPAIQALVDEIDTLAGDRTGPHPDYNFGYEEVVGLLGRASEAHGALGGSPGDVEAVNVDAPRRFDGDTLVRSVEVASELLGVAEHTETLLLRLRSLLRDSRIGEIIQDEEGVTLEGWLEDLLGGDDQPGAVSVIDLSLVPSEVVHIATAVIARILFEALQRYRKLTRRVLPTALVMEEAHTFVKRYRDEAESPDAAATCCQVFERIAREGRKFGLGLVLSSQRPSELSPTVLSQCNTFLLHRITNDRDQELVQRLVPDNLRGLLRELPSFPSQHAILLGWASELPVRVQVKSLARDHQPQSDDPDFWDVWTGQTPDGENVVRLADWEALAREWQGAGASEPGKGTDESGCDGEL